MKKIGSIMLFFGLLVSILLVVVLQQANRQRHLSQFENNCQKLPSSSFASERAHGIIIRDNTLASVRLAGERNFSPPGGHLEASETPEIALSRELQEELHISVDKKDLKPFKVFCEILGATKTQRTYTYFVEKWSKPIQVGPKDQFKWVSYEYKLDKDADTELVKLLELLYHNRLLKSTL